MKPVIFYRHADDTDTATDTMAEVQTDNTKLVLSGSISISPDGGSTDEAFPKPNVPYDFVVNVANSGPQKTDSFFVKFQFNPESENPNPDAELTFTQDAGLDPGADVWAVVHFGSFPNQFSTYHLDACIYASSAPDTPINCTSYDITINTEDSAGTSNSGDSNSTSGDGTTADTSSSSDTPSDTSSGTDNTPTGGSSDTTTDNTSSSGSTSAPFVPISYEVELIPQPDKVSCWAASMAMVLSYKRQQSINPETLANEVGRSLRTSYSWDMLEEVRDHYGFKSVVDVPADTCSYYEPQQWKEWLETCGPLWYTFIWNSGGSHAMVLKGISGDLTREGTFFEIQNPWDLHTTFDGDAIDFNPANNGCSEKIEFLKYSSLFGDLGYDVNHAGFRIMYLE